MTKRKQIEIEIEVEAMAGMTRREARITNFVMNTLVERHHLCVDCAIGAAVMIAKIGRPKKNKHKPLTTRLCSDTCAEAWCEFCEETVGVKGELVSEDDLPPTAQ
jgi:ribosomal protein S26